MPTFKYSKRCFLFVITHLARFINQTNPKNENKQDRKRGAKRVAPLLRKEVFEKRDGE